MGKGTDRSVVPFPALREAGAMISQANALGVSIHPYRSPCQLLILETSIPPPITQGHTRP
jgi:hypothetical protein